MEQVDPAVLKHPGPWRAWEGPRMTNITVAQRLCAAFSPLYRCNSAFAQRSWQRPSRERELRLRLARERALAPRFVGGPHLRTWTPRAVVRSASSPLWGRNPLMGHCAIR